jgi:hypothetical protein
MAQASLLRLASSSTRQPNDWLRDWSTGRPIAFYDRIKSKPDSTFGNAKADVLADKDPVFRG